MMNRSYEFGTDVLIKCVTRMIKDCQEVKNDSDKAWIIIDSINQLLDRHAEAGFPEIGEHDPYHQG